MGRRMSDAFMEVWVQVAPWVFGGVSVLLTPLLCLQVRQIYREYKQQKGSYVDKF